MESHRFIGKSEHRRPNEMWLRRRRSARTDMMIQFSDLQLPQNTLPKPKNPVPLLAQDEKIMHEAANIPEIRRKPRIIQPKGNPPKIA